MNNELPQKCKVGTILSFSMAICYIAVAVLFFLQPPVQRIRIGSTDEAFLAFFHSYNQSPTLHLSIHIVAALLSLFALGVIPSVSQYLNIGAKSWGRWFSHLGYLGYGVFALANARSVNSELDLAKVITAVDGPNLLVAIGTGKLIELERLGIITFGCVAIWVIGMSLIGLKTNKFSKLHSLCGIGFGLMCLFIMVDFWPIFGVGRPAQIAIGLGSMILGPLWYFGLGCKLKNEE